MSAVIAILKKLGLSLAGKLGGFLGSVITFLLPYLLDYLKGVLAKMIESWKAKRRKEELGKAVEELKKPVETIEEASDAACKAEKILNPHSDCDSP